MQLKIWACRREKKGRRRAELRSVPSSKAALYPRQCYNLFVKEHKKDFRCKYLYSLPPQ